MRAPDRRWNVPAKIALAALVLALVPAAAAAGQPTLAGSWQRLPQTPASASMPYERAGVWTGAQLIVFGRIGTPGAMRNAAYSFTPATGRWRTLSPPPGPTASYEGALAAVWTGRLMLVVGPFTTLSYAPATNRWRQLPKGPSLGAPSGRLDAAAVWTGKKLLLWGGSAQYKGQEALAPHGLAFDPKASRWLQLPGAPLNGRVNPLAVWTGRALLVWGGDPLRSQAPPPDDWWPLLDGATFTPRA